MRKRAKTGTFLRSLVSKKYMCERSECFKEGAVERLHVEVFAGKQSRFPAVFTNSAHSETYT